MGEPTHTTMLNRTTDLTETSAISEPEYLPGELEAQHLELAAALPMNLAPHHPEPGFLRRLYKRLPKGQMLRYLCVGCFNTALSNCLFVLFNHVFYLHHVPASYMFALLLANAIAISVAFFGYKLVVFRTRGNYFKEWLKANAVFWTGFLPQLAIMPGLVWVFKQILPAHIAIASMEWTNVKFAPYPASACLTVVSVVYNFIGHKKVTFKAAKQPAS